MARKRSSQQEVSHPIAVDAPDGLLDVIGAAKWFGVGRTKLFEMMREDDFPVIRITDRLVRFDPNGLYQWALSRQQKPTRSA